MISETEPKWYWLATNGVAWVRANLPDAKVRRFSRVAVSGRGWVEHRDVEVVAFAHGGLSKARKAKLKPQEANVETVCGVCSHSYVPHFENDPCIPNLPGIKFACCGHGKGRGYVTFESGVVIRFEGTASIERNIDLPKNRRKTVSPSDPLYFTAATERKS